MEFKHIPVLLNETIEGLNIKKDGVYVDCTIGGGGHSMAILSHLSQEGRLIGLDRDIDAIKVCKDKFKDYKNVTIVHSNFKDIKMVLQNLGIEKVDGILADLGVSSYQIDTPSRGFSYYLDGKLDMRMDVSQKLSAYEVVNNYSKEKLLKILYEYGEESNAKRIVENICFEREKGPIEYTSQLKEIIEKAFPQKVIFGKGGVSKKTFQAIRIEVNQELEKLKQFLLDGIDLLKIEGRFAVITFHSLEDRIVKNTFKESSTGCICPPKTPICICGHKQKVNLINKKPLIAGERELKDNPRSSSAKLRIIEKL